MREKASVSAVIYLANCFTDSLQAHTGRIEQYHAIVRIEKILIIAYPSGGFYDE